jgi:hypothetical protein
LPLLARRLQLAVPRGINLHLTSRQHVRWCDKSNGAVQAQGVVSLISECAAKASLM